MSLSKVSAIGRQPPDSVMKSPGADAEGKIAMKVINHYGDEVLKVYPVK